MHAGTENVIAWGMDDPEAFNPIKEPMEIDSRCVDDSASPKAMKGILIAIPVGLSMWAVIIPALSKLF